MGDFPLFHCENMKAVLFVGLLVVAISYGFVPQYSNCGSSSDKLKIQSISFNPMNLTAGDKVTVTVKGQLTEEVTGGTVTIKAALDGIPVLNKAFPLCTILANISLSCPLQPKTFTQTNSFTLPTDLPSGNITGSGRAVDQNGA